MTRSLGIVVPAFEPDPDRLSRYVEAIDRQIDPDAIRVELDDPTPGVVDALRGLPASIAVSSRRRGKGAAITAGFESLDTDVLAFADADGSTAAVEFERVVTPVVNGEADLAVGSRRHPESTVASHQTFARRYLGDGFAALARMVLDAQLYDYQCGAKAIDAAAWKAVREQLHEPGFAWDIELIALVGAHSYRIEEVPIEWEDVPGSTVSPIRDTLGMARGVFAARHRARLRGGNRIHRLVDRTLSGSPSVLDRVAESDESRTFFEERQRDTDGTGGGE
ncbi:MAG: glycosyltransferase [Halobacteriota archaeon]